MGSRTVAVVSYRQYGNPESSASSAFPHRHLCAAPFACRCPEGSTCSTHGTRDPTHPSPACEWEEDTEIGVMERYHAALDGRGAQGPSLHAAKGLAASLLQRVIWAAVQHAVLPAGSHCQGIPARIRSSFPHYDPFVHSYSFSHALGSRRTRKTGTGRTEALSLEGTQNCSRRSRAHGAATPTVGSATASS